jgi:hypothetical protein
MHLRFHTYKQGWTDAAVRRYVRDAGALYERLNALTRADVTTGNARRARAIQRRVDELEARVDELGAEELEAMRPAVDGNAIMRHLGIRPGPIVGEAWQHLLDLRLEHGPMERGGGVGRPGRLVGAATDRIRLSDRVRQHRGMSEPLRAVVARPRRSGHVGVPSVPGPDAPAFYVDDRAVPGRRVPPQRLRGRHGRGGLAAVGRLGLGPGPAAGRRVRRRPAPARAGGRDRGHGRRRGSGAGRAARAAPRPRDGVAIDVRTGDARSLRDWLGARPAPSTSRGRCVRERSGPRR